MFFCFANSIHSPLYLTFDLKMKGHNFSKHILVHSLLIAIIGVALYFQGLNNGYSKLDDVIMIENNWDGLHDWNNWRQVFLDDVFKEPKGSYYRPIQTLSYMIDVWLFEPEKNAPASFFVSNLIHFVLNSLLLYFFLLYFKFPKWTTLLASLLFLLHPSVVPAVAWIPGKIELYLFTFTLLAIWSIDYFYSTRKPMALIGYLIALSLALFTKETAVSIPILAFGLHLFFHSKQELPSGLHLATLGKGILEFSTTQKTVWITTTIITLSYLVIRSSVLSDTEHGIIYLAHQILYLPFDFIILFGATIFPYDLAVFQDLKWKLLILPSLVLFVTAFLISPKKINTKYFQFGLLWMICILIPASLTDKINYHRLYIPLIGFLFMIRSIDWQDWKKQNKYLPYLIGVYFGFLLYSNLNFQHVFDTKYSFWKNALKHSPKNELTNRGIAYLYHMDKNFDSAFVYYHKALQADSMVAQTRMGLALIHHEWKEHEQVDALVHEEFKYTKDSIFVSANYAEILLERGDERKALNWFRKANQLSNNNLYLHKVDSLEKKLKNIYTLD